MLKNSDQVKRNANFQVKNCCSSPREIKNIAPGTYYITITAIYYLQVPPYICLVHISWNHIYSLLKFYYISGGCHHGAWTWVYLYIHLVYFVSWGRLTRSGYLLLILLLHSCLAYTLYGSLSEMQVQNPHSIKYNGTMQGLKYIRRTEGFRGLFKGNGTNCARIVPNSAVKFFSYEQASRFVISFLHWHFVDYFQA